MLHPNRHLQVGQTQGKELDCGHGNVYQNWLLHRLSLAPKFTPTEPGSLPTMHGSIAFNCLSLRSLVGAGGAGTSSGLSCRRTEEVSSDEDRPAPNLGKPWLNGRPAPRISTSLNQFDGFYGFEHEFQTQIQRKHTLSVHSLH